jgi:hypothetical protein
VARKIKDSAAWGVATASERYGGGSKTGLVPSDVGDQAPQCPDDKHGPKYDNDVPLSGWLRGPDATKKPGFTKPWDKR